MPQTQMEYVYTMAAFCYQNGVVPKDRRARRIIQSWQRHKLLQLRRKRRESEMSRTMRVM